MPMLMTSVIALPVATPSARERMPSANFAHGGEHAVDVEHPRPCRRREPGCSSGCEGPCAAHGAVFGEVDRQNISSRLASTPPVSASLTRRASTSSFTAVFEKSIRRSSSEAVKREKRFGSAAKAARISVALVAARGAFQLVGSGIHGRLLCRARGSRKLFALPGANQVQRSS